MPLLPIDLQTMFSQMTQIGREQAVQKEAPPLYQAAQAAEMVQKAEHDDKAVNQARESGEKEGAEKIGDAGRRRRRRREPGRKEKSPPPAEPPSGVFEDPALGHNVDLIG
jgi:hypothetical protein